MSIPPRNHPRLAALVELFYPTVDELARFEPTPAESLPAPARMLLHHDQHMTVTMEKYHASPVEVRVLSKNVTDSHYAREILLCSQRDGAVVQYGIMRVGLAHFDDTVRREIIAESTPLGRVLIQHDVMRRVELAALWKLTPGEALRRHLCLDADATTYGRTALIYVQGEPAVELLEVAGRF